jgi:hypothetical protein
MGASAWAGTILGGLEDTPGTAGYESYGDFNDLMFSLTGNFTVNAPGGVFSSVTAGLVNEDGTPFWDHLSQDGTDMNIGYQLLSGPYATGLQYLANPDDSAVSSVTFTSYSDVTISFLGGITVNTDSLGWYSLSDPTTLHPLFTSDSSIDDSVIISPGGEFALYSTDGWGQTYSSVAASNVGDSTTQQHFAFFDPPAVVPEPAAFVLTGTGLGLLGLVVRRRRKKR